MNTLNNHAMFIFLAAVFVLYIIILTVTLILLRSRRKRFLEAENASRFRLLVENSSDSMFLYNYKTRTFEYVSPGINELIGVSDAQLYKMPERFFDYINVEEKNADIINIFSQPVTEPGNGVLCLYKNDEIIKWSQIHYLPISVSGNTVTAVEGILRDISEQKKMEIDLKTSVDNRKELLENISHEIKTPITLIQGYTEMLLDKMLPTESTDTYLKMINSKAQMLTNLLDDLTNASHVDSQVMEYRFYEQNALEFFKEMMDHSKFQISSTGHVPVISFNISPQAIIITDPYRMQQVISNLINNACRHTPEGGEIHISCQTFFHEELLHVPEISDGLSMPDGELIFLVSDRGDGISAEHMPYIFERNYSEGKKVNPNVTADYEKGKSNSGLGLYISKQIITQHSGRMFAKNNVFGGADVSFTLPYYKE